MRSYASYVPMMMLALAFCLLSLGKKPSPKVSIGLSAVALSSLADFDVSLAVWTITNIATALLLVPSAWWCLFGGTKPLDLNYLADEVAPLTAFFALSLPISGRSDWGSWQSPRRSCSLQRS